MTFTLGFLAVIWSLAWLAIMGLLFAWLTHTIPLAILFKSERDDIDITRPQLIFGWIVIGALFCGLGDLALIMFNANVWPVSQLITLWDMFSEAVNG